MAESVTVDDKEYEYLRNLEMNTERIIVKMLVEARDIEDEIGRLSAIRTLQELQKRLGCL